MSLDFSGGQYLTTAAAVLPATGDFSVAFSVAPDSATGNQRCVTQETGGTGRLFISSSISGAGEVRFFVHASTDVSIDAADALDNNAFTPVVCVRSGDDFSLYVKGELEGTQTQAGVTVEQVPLAIAAEGDGSNELDGSLAEVAIFDRALSAAEIKLLAAGHRPTELYGGAPAFYQPLVSAANEDESLGAAVTVNGSPAEDTHPQLSLLVAAIGPQPAPTDFKLMAWRERGRRHFQGYLEESSKQRDTTFYIDAEGGDDANPGTQALPWKTLDHTQDNLIAGARYRLKRGSRFIGLGANETWEASGPHRAALYVTQSCVIDTYGDPADDPPLFLISDPLGAVSWTQDGAAYYCDVSGYSDIDDLFETDHTTTRFTIAASVANCQATERSFYYDSAADRLYVHFDGAAEPPATLYPVERNRTSFFRLEAGDGETIVCDLGHACMYGAGRNATDTNSHDYAFNVGVDGTGQVIVGNARPFYGSAHLAGMWQAGSNETHGLMALLNIEGLHTTTTASGRRIISNFCPGGGTEYYFFNVRSADVNIDGVAINGHGSAGSRLGYMLFDHCGGSTISSDETAGISFGNYFGTPTNRAGTGTLPRTINVNPCYLFGSGGNGMSGNRLYDFFNAFFSLHSTTSSDPNLPLGIFNESADHADIISQFLHCYFGLLNKANGHSRGVGVSYDTLRWADSATNGLADRCLFSNEGDTVSGKEVAPGIGDSDDNQTNCSYYDIVDTGGIQNQGGYANVTTANELASRPIDYSGDEITLELPEALSRAMAASVGYDARGRRRTGNTSDDGPYIRRPVYSKRRSFYRNRRRRI